MTAIPQLLPAPSQPTQQPYLTPAQFRAYPTWLDTSNLIPGGLASVQDDDLADVLLAASSWADDVCEGMRLSAHLVTGEQWETRVAGGRITIQPRDIPVRGITALSYGWDPASMAALALPDASVRISAGRLVSFRPGGAQAFMGPAIQFGPGPASNGKVYGTWSYPAGFASTFLSASCAASAATITLADPTCVMPGDTLRIYDQGQDGSGASEALTVATTYVPQVPTVPPTFTSVPLASNTLYAHAAGTGITGFERRALQAVIAYSVALLMREDVADMDPSPESQFGPAVRTASGDRGGAPGSGLVNDARGWLARYRPVWR